MKISVVIVNFNTKDILRDCLNHLSNSSGIFGGLDHEVIVVDNGSSDGSAAMVESEFPDINLIKTENNGLSAGYNIGTRASSGDYILYLGSDAFPDNGTIVQLANYLKSNNDVGAVTCNLVLRNGESDMDAHRGFPTPWVAFTHFSGLEKVFPKSKLFGGYFLGWKDMNKAHEIDMCISHFLMIKRSIWEKIGEWDETFFVYGEDVDYCYRIKQAGYKIMYLPNYKATHYKGVSVGIRNQSKDVSSASEEVRTKMSKETVRAMQIFYKKHMADRYPSIITNAVLLGTSILGKIRQRRSK